MSTTETRTAVKKATSDTKAATTRGAAVGGGGGAGVGVLIVWGAGYLGADMTAEVGAIIGGGAATLTAAIAAFGLIPLVRRMLFGPPG